MKRVLAIAIAIAFAPLAGAEMYKYVDKNGKTVYTDQPPANVDSKPVHMPKSVTAPAAAPSKDVAAGNKSAVTKDKELDKAREQAKGQQKKQEEAAEKERLAEQRCTQARTAFRQFSEGGRIVKYNEKGERVYLGDAEIESGREKARQEVEEACKAS